MPNLVCIKTIKSKVKIRQAKKRKNEKKAK